MPRTSSLLKFSVRAERSATGAKSKRANLLIAGHSYFDSASLRSIRTAFYAFFNKLLVPFQLVSPSEVSMGRGESFPIEAMW